MNPRCLSLFLAALSMVVAIAPLTAQTPSNSAKEIATIREQWVTNWNAMKIEPIVKLYAQDAVLLPSAGQRIEGRDAIENYLKQAMASSTGHLIVTPASLKDSGKQEVDSGSFKDTLKGGGSGIGGKAGIGGNAGFGGGGSREVNGDYRVVLRRGRDGKWLIELGAWNEVSPAAK
jgi:ketosteroid isomerase-like protein